MRIFIFSFILLTAAIVNAQSTKIDKTLLSKTNWIQADESPNGLESPLNAERDAQYKSNKLAFYKQKKWGSLLNNKNQFVVGNWEIKDNQIILYDIYAKDKGFNCDIIELTKDSLIISYVDLHKIPRTIKLIPS